MYTGSTWNRWDLHVHTPASIVNHYGGNTDAVWEQFITDIENLPNNIHVIGVNDYLLLEGYQRVIKEWMVNRRMQNIKLFLPVLEFRLKVLAGTEKKLRKINYHVIFSDTIGNTADDTIDIITTNFLSNLKVQSDLSKASNTFKGSLNRRTIETFGNEIKKTVPPEKLHQFKSDLVEGFNAINFDTEHIFHALDKTVFAGKYVTAVGKTEWGSLSLNDQSIATKKDIINRPDLVFTASPDIETFRNAKQNLEKAGFNSLLFDCSDSHHFSNSEDKDRLGNCMTWVKGDPIFETLKQVVCDPISRLHIGTKPQMPLHKLEHIEISFPIDTLATSPSFEQTDFCFRGNHTIPLSPYFTCITGGRGSGKSTLINLVQEAFNPNSSALFQKMKLISDHQVLKVSDNVVIDNGTTTVPKLEIVNQNQIENYANNSKLFTDAIYSRLLKTDSQGMLELYEAETLTTVNQFIEYSNLVFKKNEYTQLIVKTKSDLHVSLSILETIDDDGYKDILKMIKKTANTINTISSRKKDLTLIIDAITGFSDRMDYESISKEPYEYSNTIIEILTLAAKISEEIRKGEKFSSDNTILETALNQLEELQIRQRTFLEERQLDTDSISDLSKASQDRDRLEKELDIYIKQLEEVSHKLQSASSKSDSKMNFDARLQEILDITNSTLSQQGDEASKVQFVYTFDYERLMKNVVAWLIKKLDLSGPYAREEYLKSVLFREDPRSIDDHKAYLSSLQQATDGKIKDYLLEIMSNDIYYESFLWYLRSQLIDTRTYKSISVTYQGKALLNVSFGQRCTATMIALLALGNTPIIIDEPEAHLDSGLIAKYLVGLIKQKKMVRQIIFATHNANFVVNGDAELVINLDGDRITDKVLGFSIEQTSYRSKLLTLEGGEEAFKLRENRYRSRIVH